MLRREVGRYLIGAALIALLAKIHYSLSKENRTQTAQQETGKGNKETVVFKSHSTNEGWHPEERTHHRIERVFWGWTTALYALTFVATAAAAWFAYSAFIQAKRQADIAERSLIESDRPLIYIHVDQSSYGSEFDASIAISNLGTKPAIIIQSDFWHNDSGIVNYSKSLEVCFVFRNEVMITERKITPDCKYSGDIKNPIHHLYGFIKYKSLAGAEWIQKIDYFLSLNDLEWNEGGGAGQNSEVRVDARGVPVQED